MISNERPSPSFRHSHPISNPPPRIVEDVLKAADLEVERKFFTFSLRENPRGRLLRITEDAQGRRNTIIIPSTGLEEFQRIFAEMTKAAGEIPESQPPAQPDYRPGSTGSRV